MKNIKYLMMALVAVLATFATTSCTDGNDWETTNGANGEYNRLFTPNSVAVSTSGGVTTVTWTTYDPGEEYIIEVTNWGKALTDADAEGAHADTSYDKIFVAPGYDTTTGAKLTSYILPEQLATSMYQLRIKARSTKGKGESHWLYFTKDNDVFFEIGGGGDEEEE